MAASSTTLGSVGADFATVFADRADSMSQLRAAIDGFLGMEPTPPAGSGVAGSFTPSDPGTPLSATEATNRIAAAGGLLTRADSLYRSVRRNLAAAAGHGRLPSRPG